MQPSPSLELRGEICVCVPAFAASDGTPPAVALGVRPRVLASRNLLDSTKRLQVCRRLPVVEPLERSRESHDILVRPEYLRRQVVGIRD